MTPAACGTQAFYTTFDIASLCGVSVMTVYRAIKEGRLPAREARSDDQFKRRQYEVMAGDVLNWRIGPEWEDIVDGASNIHP